MLLNDKWVNNEIKEEIKNYLETNKNEHPAYQKPMEHSKRIPEREVHSITGLPKEDRKISNHQPNPMPKRTRGTTTNKAHNVPCVGYVDSPVVFVCRLLLAHLLVGTPLQLAD